MKRYPSSDFAKVVPINNAPDYSSTAQSLHTITTSTGSQRWEFEVTTAWERLSVARGLWMFLSARRSQKFEIQLPIYDTPNGVVTGAVSAAASYPIGTSQVNFVTFVPAMGDFVQFAGHSKIYGVEADGELVPPLIKAVGAMEAVTVNNLTFTVRREGPLLKLDGKGSNVGKIKFKIVEAW